MKGFNTLVDGIKLTDEEREDIMADSNIFTSFISIFNGESDKIYLPIDSMPNFKELLNQKLE